MEGSSPGSLAVSGSSSVPLLDLKAILKDSLVEVLRENPSVLHQAPESATCSSELSCVSLICGTVLGITLYSSCSSSTGKLRG